MEPRMMKDKKITVAAKTRMLKRYKKVTHLAKYNEIRIGLTHLANKIKQDLLSN